MEPSNSGGNGALDSDSSASPPPKCDISSRLQQARESWNAWKQLLDEGKVERLVVKIDSPPELAGKARMLSAAEQDQLRETGNQISAYIARVLSAGRTK